MKSEGLIAVVNGAQRVVTPLCTAVPKSSAATQPWAGSEKAEGSEWRRMVGVLQHKVANVLRIWARRQAQLAAKALEARRQEEADAERLVCLVGSETKLECSCLVCVQQAAAGDSPREGGHGPDDSMQSLQSSLQAVQVRPIDAAKAWATVVLVRWLEAAAQRRAVLAMHAVAGWAQRFRGTKCNRLYTAPSGKQMKCRLLSAAGGQDHGAIPRRQGHSGIGTAVAHQVRGRREAAQCEEAGDADADGAGLGGE